MYLLPFRPIYFFSISITFCQIRAPKELYGGVNISVDDYLSNELGEKERIIPKTLHRALLWFVLK